MHPFSRLLSVALLGLAVVLPASAQWVWRDKNNQNRVTASQMPPPAYVDDKDVISRPASQRRVQAPAAAASAPNAAASDVAAPAPKLVEPELEAKRRQAEEQEAAKRKQEDQKVAAAKADNCARARSYMRTLDDGLRIARTNAKGEREILNDQQRAEEAKRTQGVIASDCK